jgi:hypothetical protein
VTGDGAPHVVGTFFSLPHPVRRWPVTAHVPPQREPGGFGERSANERRQNALHRGRAARTVAGRAVDAQDCRDLLDMLGLAAEAGRADEPPQA